MEPEGIVATDDALKAETLPKYTGQLRVGRIKYVNGQAVRPRYPGFKPIVVLTASSPYGSLGPYVLKDEEGCIMENIWQAAKTYPMVPCVKIPFSQRDRRIVWEHPAEIHVDTVNGVLADQPNETYWAWREKLLHNKEAVRYPVGNDTHKATCLYALAERGGAKLDYVAARKQIYLPTYVRLVREQYKYSRLIDMLEAGLKLNIIEVDGPHQEAMAYYRSKYQVPDNWIEHDTILVTPKNMAIMLNDTKYAFGHGYCLAMALSGLC